MPFRFGPLELVIVLIFILSAGFTIAIVRFILALVQQKADATTSGNTSGQGSAALVPEGVKGWNFGAFFFTWIWGLANNVWLALLALIPAAWLVMAALLGFKGNEWAWQSRRWESVAQFKRVQRAWEHAAWALLAVLMLAVLLVAWTPLRLGYLELLTLVVIMAAVVAFIVWQSARKTV